MECSEIAFRHKMQYTACTNLLVRVGEVGGGGLSILSIYLSSRGRWENGVGSLPANPPTPTFNAERGMQLMFENLPCCISVCCNTTTVLLQELIAGKLIFVALNIKF